MYSRSIMPSQIIGYGLYLYFILRRISDAYPYLTWTVLTVVFTYFCKTLKRVKKHLDAPSFYKTTVQTVKLSINQTYR